MIYLKKEKKECNSKNEHCGGGLKHGLMMILCCLLPILLILGLPLIGIQGSKFSFIIFLLCPLMHIFMMFNMKKDKS